MSARGPGSRSREAERELSFEDPRKRLLVMAGLHAYEAVTNSGRLVPSLNALGCCLHFADFGEKNGDK